MTGPFRSISSRYRLKGALVPVFFTALVAALSLSAATAGAAVSIIYPVDGTAVSQTSITVLGAVTGPGEMPILHVNGKKVIPYVKPDGVFEQVVRLKPGVNKVLLKRESMSILLVPNGQVPADFSRRNLHPALDEGCGACHSLEKRGDLALVEEGKALCLQCHDDPSAGKAHSHEAMEEGCTACHDPHSGVGPGLNIEALPGLCYQCHDPVAEGKKAPHEPAAAGGCPDCHDPHGAANGKLLTAAPEELCLQCHDDPAEGAAVAHEAMEDGCLTCHSPHGSDTAPALIDEQPALCAQCHDDVVPAGRKVNGHSPIADDGECSACHRPHGGPNPKLLVLSPPELCYQCHDNVLEVAGESGSLHPPAEEGSCTDCHNPHGGPSALLVSTEVCFDCHDAFEAPGGGSLHDPVGEGECVECHSPHASPNRHLVRQDGTGLCYRCHDEFEGQVVHSPIADDDSCLECHNPHTGKGAHLLDTRVMDVCLQCHDNPVDISMNSLRATVHGPIRDEGNCAGCHSPHAGGVKLLRDPQPELCYRCHKDPTLDSKGDEYEFIHGPVAMGMCTACHQPHSSVEGKLLNVRGLDVCLGCHEDPAVDDQGRPWPSSHPPVSRDCLQCHDPHASAEKGHLKEPAFDLCSDCHPEHKGHKLDASRAVSGQTTMVHLPPLFPLSWDNQLVCTGCHRPHGAYNRPLLKTDKMVMCMNCH